jgi:integrase
MPMMHAGSPSGSMHRRSRARTRRPPGPKPPRSKKASAPSWASYLGEARGRLRPRSYPDVERHLLVYAKALRPLELAKITRRDVASVLSVVTDGHGPVSGNRTRTSLSSFFSWAMQHGLVDTNPVVGTPKHKERPRERVLSMVELALIWNACGEDDFGRIVRLLMLTGCRRDEIGGLRWSEVHGDMIVLPGERTKGHRAHIAPLSPPALAILSKQQVREGRDLVFGRYEHTGAFSGWSQAKPLLDKRIAEASGKLLAAWVLHDLRRSCATQLGELGVAPHTIENLLGHAGKSHIASIYNRSRYQNEVRAASNLWADRLMAAVEGRESNVAPLRREA